MNTGTRSTSVMSSKDRLREIGTILAHGNLHIFSNKRVRNALSGFQLHGSCQEVV